VGVYKYKHKIFIHCLYLFFLNTSFRTQIFADLLISRLMLFHSYVAHFSQIFYIMIISLLAFVPHEEEPFTIPNVFSARQFLIHDIHPQSNDTYFFLFLSLFYFILFFFGTFFSCVTFNEVNVSGPFFFFFFFFLFFFFFFVTRTFLGYLVFVG